MKSDKRKVKIYVLQDPRDNSIRYLGKTIQPIKRRLYQHCTNHNLNRNKTHKNSWIKNLKKKNLRPRIKVIHEVSQEEWEFWESYWISQFKAWGFNLTNLTDGGEGSLGGTGSLGYKHTEEAKRKISEANSGPRRKDWIKASSEANKKPILQLSKGGEFIKRWKSATDAAIYLGDKNKKKNISTCCRNNRNSAYGYDWIYENTELRNKFS